MAALAAPMESRFAAHCVVILPALLALGKLGLVVTFLNSDMGPEHVERLVE